MNRHWDRLLQYRLRMPRFRIIRASRKLFILPPVRRTAHGAKP
jgi:hypothetical protein